MRSHKTLLGTALTTLGGVACAGAWAAATPPAANGGQMAGPADRQPQALILAAATDAPSIVTIDGKRWRKAPASEIGRSGRAGTRIILDGELWLRANNPVFRRAAGTAPEPDTATAEAAAQGGEAAPEGSESTPTLAAANSDPRAAPESAPAAAPEPAIQAAQPSDGSARQPAVEPEPVAIESREQLQVRQQALLADARRRAAAREEERMTRRAARGQARQAKNDAALLQGLAMRAESLERERELAEASARDAAAADIVAEQAAGEAAFVQTVTVSALQIPGTQRNQGSEFSYVQLMPISYDIGGAGVMLEGSTEVRERMHLMVRAGIADRYQEALVGAGVHYSPPSANRLTLMLSAGYEYGVFPLESANTGLQVDDTSGGPFITAATRLVLNPRFMIEGGVGYSSFHDGDPIGFGSGFFHVNDTLDLMSRIELGDQDSYGIGLRVNY